MTDMTKIKMCDYIMLILSSAMQVLSSLTVQSWHPMRSRTTNLLVGS